MTDEEASSRPKALHARGRRHDWSTLPEQIVARIESVLGGPIQSATTSEGGFSPGIAARITTATDAAFVKAVSVDVNADAAKFHRREIAISNQLSAIPGLPVPRLRWSLDDAESGWVVLMFDLVEGRPLAQPWVAGELDRVVESMNRLSTLLTPTPIPHPPVPLASEMGVLTINYWRDLVETPNPRLDAWSARHLNDLVTLSGDAQQAIEGDTLLHLDLRADNMLVSDSQVWIVDWPHAGIGAAWLDPMAMAPSVTMHDGPLPEEFMARFDSVRGADPLALSAGLAQLAGFFVFHSLQPEIPALPGLRDFQAAQGQVACEWLARRLGWD